MISSIEIRNFRCFKEHKISFQSFTIAVGSNNAGKSTLVEALRLVSIVSTRIQGLNFHDKPKWLDAPRAYRGVRPSLAGLQINEANIPYSYGTPPSEIIATFSTGEKIAIYIGDKLALHAVIFDRRGSVVSSRSKSMHLRFPKVAILPQIGPLAREEKILTEDYIKGAMSSSLSSLHFRNQLKYFYHDFFREFKQIAESTWGRLQIRELEGRKSRADGTNLISLLVRDNDFVAEIGWMGHGLQMWLQIMWFLTYSAEASTVILDEPDVYMHADLQRKLVKILRGRYSQIIMATHSIEIMSEAAPENILIVDRHQKESFFATSLPDVQKTIENFGGVHNMHLARLWNSKRLILLEGDDMVILKHFHSLLYPNSDMSFDSIPQFSIGGWSGWPYVIGSSMLLRNSGGEKIIVYCILDSDYHIEAEKQTRLTQAKEKDIQLHIWMRKEIENFLVIPTAIEKIVKAGNRKGKITKEQVVRKISSICNELKDDTTDSYANEFHLSNRGSGVQNANRLARTYVDKRWHTVEDKMAIVSGKKLLARLSEWSQNKYGISFGIRTILNAIDAHEIPIEVRTLLDAIEAGRSL